ncbi:MAG: hypothetical protein ABSF44_04400 [Candidatus Bathyarchaeia archaeon]|jgi:hypothetical protein
MVISVLAIFAVFLIASTTVQAATPKITLRLSSGPVGTSILVTGTGFSSHEYVTVTYFGTTTKIYTSSIGGFAFPFKAPTTAMVGKTYTVTATSTCRESACASFCVTRLFVTPESPIGALAALGACFAALLTYKRKSLPHLRLNIHT